MRFDWQTEAGDAVMDAPALAPARRGARWLRFASLVFLALALGAGSIALVARRAEALSAQAAEDVVASVHLLERAIDRRDEELLRSVLSGREPEWADRQAQLLRSGQLFDFPALGLRATGVVGEPEVTVASDLVSADVRLSRDYAVATASGVTTTVTLRQEQVYRRGASRWLWSPPLDTAPAWQSIAGERLRLNYAADDAAFAARLHADMEAGLAQLCTGELACRHGRLLTVRLVPEGPAGMAADESLALPAPSWIGVPLGEAAIAALADAYFLRGIAAADLTGGAPRQSFTAALARPLAASVGRGPARLPAAIFRRALREGLTLRDLVTRLAPSWEGPPGAVPDDGHQRLADLLVAYLLASGADAAVLRNAMASAPDLVRWASPHLDALADPRAASQVEADFRRFLVAGAGLENTAGPGPGQDLLALCRPDDGDRRGRQLFRYEAAKGTWRNLGGAGFVSMVALPDGMGVLLQPLDWTREDGSGRFRSSKSVVLWRDDRFETVYHTPPSMGVTVQSLSSDGRWVALQERPLDGSDEGHTVFLPLSSCADGRCDAIRAPAGRYSSWSADGRHVLVLTPGGRLLAGEPASLAPVALDVQTAAWLGNGSLLLLPEGSDEVRSASLSATGRVQEGAPRNLPAALAPLARDLRFLGTVDSGVEQMLVAARSDPGQPVRTDFIWWDLESGAATHWMTAERAVFRPELFHLPGDGAGVSATIWRAERLPSGTPSTAEDSYGELVWRDMASGRQASYHVRNWFVPGTAAWDGTGQWLAIARDDAVLLVAPAQGAMRLISLRGAHCSRVAWTDR